MYLSQFYSRLGREGVLRCGLSGIGVVHPQKFSLGIKNERVRRKMKRNKEQLRVNTPRNGTDQSL